MGKNLQKLYSFRTDETLIQKLKIISREHTRTRNKEIEYALKLYVKDYEEKYGEIQIEKE